MVEVTWQEFKIMITKNIKWIYTQQFNDYVLFGSFGSVNIKCFLKQDSADLVEFEQSYKNNQPKASELDSQGRPLYTASPFTDAAGFRFRGASFTGTATANSTTNIDYKITNERYINGGRLLLSSQSIDDRISFQVVDKDNILGYGANVVLDEFITNYYLPSSGNLEVKLDYPARIPGGLYVRLIYVNTSLLTNVDVKCNLYLHWKAV